MLKAQTEKTAFFGAVHMVAMHSSLLLLPTNCLCNRQSQPILMIRGITWVPLLIRGAGLPLMHH